MTNQGFRIPALRIAQSGKTLYLAMLTAGQLLKCAITTEWNPDLGWDLDKQDYQRAPIAKHYLAIARFLASESQPFMPTSALLAAREADFGMLPFEERVTTGDHSFGYLSIPEGRLLYIVDYQHRWRGLKYAIENLKKQALENYVVPTIIMADVIKYEEIKQFYLINNKQKRVDSDLALALLYTMATNAQEPELYNLVGSGKRYLIRATRLAFRIAARPDGPWVGRIQEPNMPRQPGQVLAPKSLAESLRPLITNRSPIYQWDDNRILEAVNTYWLGVKDVMPEAFANPEGYAVQKTPGAYVLHRVAREIFRNNGPLLLTSDNIANTLNLSATFMKADFWRTSGAIGAYGGSSGQKALADLIIREITP